MECAPAMWCAGDLVIVRNGDGAKVLGTIIEAKLEWINHMGNVWMYETWVEGRLISIFERRFGEFKIVQCLSEETDLRWEMLEDSSKLEIW